MWGDGKQTRSFTYIDDCVGVSSVSRIDFAELVNLGSDEMVSMNEMQALALGFAGKPDLPIKHIPGPEWCAAATPTTTSSRRSSGTCPPSSWVDGLKVTYEWIEGKIKEKVAAGANAEESFSKSTICGTMAPTELGALRAADGQENLAK